MLLPTPTLADGYDWERQIWDLLNPDANNIDYTDEELDALEALGQPLPQAA